MNERQNSHYLLFGPAPRARWPQLVLIAALGVGLTIAALFFFVFALIVAAIAATAIGIRVWWLMRKLRAQARNSEALQGEYTVIHSARTADRLER